VSCRLKALTRAQLFWLNLSSRSDVALGLRWGKCPQRGCVPEREAELPVQTHASMGVTKCFLVVHLYCCTPSPFSSHVNAMHYALASIFHSVPSRAFFPNRPPVETRLGCIVRLKLFRIIGSASQTPFPASCQTPTGSVCLVHSDRCSSYSVHPALVLLILARRP
jgi:hypothetical protein